MSTSPLNSKTLVIIDMQPEAPAARDEQVMAAVHAEIDIAKENQWPICIVQVPCLDFYIRKIALKPTHESIMQKLKDYPHYTVVDKDTTDGGYVLIAACKDKGYNTSHFRVCGVLTEACVFETVRTLSHRFNATVEVVKAACNSQDGCDKHWLLYAPLTSVILVD